MKVILSSILAATLLFSVPKTMNGYERKCKEEVKQKGEKEREEEGMMGFLSLKLSSETSPVCISLSLSLSLYLQLLMMA